MPIDPLPSISRSDANFRTQVDDYFLTRLPAFSTQAESARLQIVAAESTTTSAASTAATAATTATTAAGTATSASASAVAAKNAAEIAAAQAVSGNVATQIHAATPKPTPADADELGITDSAASWGLKKLTFANLKAWIGGLFVSKSGDTMTGQLISKKSFGDGASSSNFVAEAEGTAQGQAAGYSFRPTFTWTADNAPRRAADIWASFSGAWATERLSFGVGAGAGNDGVNRTMERLAITGDGYVLVTGGGGLGYGAGSGGTVTQETSKSTAVALNKPCGQITMHDEELGFAAEVSFVFVNAYIGPADGVLIRQTGFTGYAVEVEYLLADTGVAVRVTNRGGARSDAVTLQFHVIKGANS